MEGNVVLLSALAEVTCGVQQLAVRAVVVLKAGGGLGSVRTTGKG